MVGGLASASPTKPEKALKLEGFVRVTNNSGEEYEDAHVRLVVGTINLVEKIAQLAHVPMTDVDRLGRVEKEELRVETASRALGGRAINEPSSQPRERQITKEGLSEYFIFSIEGTETIPNGWSKRMRSLEADAVPVKIQYRYRPAEYGDHLVRMYLLTNDKASKLGDSPLPDGAVRIFRDNGRGGLSYLVTQSVKYIPIGDKIELNLGVDPNVIFELIKLRISRDNLWMKLNGVEVYQPIGQPGLRFEQNATVAGWDEHQVFTQRIRNYTAVPIEVEVRRQFPGDITFRSTLKPTLYDYQTAQFTGTVDAGKKADFPFELVHREGHNAKQSNVKLEEAMIAGN